ncbi:hypothetical protein DPMN_019336 [Dreissena polymorpha]|uniref:Uncharacterized protein n=1 Tax=Dreissena polymorpha TaxID=45954 RepID=A0A9D4NI85_DREPO|nr:hypothetical protein DPMN_019336 [Dreissena polymorpha]
MSFIEPQNVVAPKIDVAHYQEGDLIKATYQKQTYDAVISEIHQFSDQTPTEPRDKLPVKRSMNPSDASEDIDLTNNAAKQNLSIKDPCYNSPCQDGEECTGSTARSVFVWMGGWDYSVRQIQLLTKFGEDRMKFRDRPTDRPTDRQTNKVTPI